MKSRKIISVLISLAMIISVVSIGLAGSFTASAATTAQVAAVSMNGYTVGIWTQSPNLTGQVIETFDGATKTYGAGTYYFLFFQGTNWWATSCSTAAQIIVDANGIPTVKDCSINGSTVTVGSGKNAKLVKDGSIYNLIYGNIVSTVYRGPALADSKLSTWSTLRTNSVKLQTFAVNSVQNLLGQLGGGVPARTVAVANPSGKQMKVDPTEYTNYYSEVKPIGTYTYDEYFLNDVYVQGIWDTIPAEFGWAQDQWTTPGVWSTQTYPGITGKAYGIALGGQNPWVLADYMERMCKASSGNLWNGWKFGYDEVTQNPYLWHQATGAFLTYENKDSLQARINYINQKNLGGVIIWEMSGDNTNTYPMTTILKQQLKDQGKNVVGYFTNWACYNDFHQKQKPNTLCWDLMTHVNYSFFQVGGTYEHETPAPANSLNSMDRWADDITGIYEPYGDPPNMIPICREAKLAYPNTKLLVSVGGWTRGDGFYQMIQSDANQTTFVNSVKAFFDKYPFFDGIDLDWEYPGSNRFPDFDDPNDRGSPGGGVDFQRYVDLCQKLRTMLDARGEGKNLLTACVPAAPANMDRQNVVAVANLCTFVNIMTYDYHGAFDPVGPKYDTAGAPTGEYWELHYNSPLMGRNTTEWATNNTVEHLLAKGIDSSKINIGTPFYTRGWGGIPTLNRTSDGKPIPAGIIDPTPFEYTSEGIAVDSISISPKPATMVVGDAPINLVATVLPANATDRTVTWQSSNSAIASVSSTGVLTAVAAGGPVTITATAGGKSDSFQVTVTAPVTYTDVVFKVLNSKVSKNLVTSEIRSSATNGLITPVLVGGKTMIPLRCLATVFGATNIVWNSTLGPQGGAEIEINGLTLSMPAGEMYFDRKNNSTGVTERIVITAGNPPVQFCTANDIYIPLRSVTEATGYKVDWQGQFWDEPSQSYLGYACITTNQNAVAGDAYFQKMYNDSKNLF